MVVDSFIDRTTQRPVALDYLDARRVPREDVRLILATHWHDDHIRGLAAIVRECTKARFACSAALNIDEFYGLLEAYDQTVVPEGFTSGVAEFNSIVRYLELEEGQGVSSRGPVWCKADTVLTETARQRVRVVALAPSDATMTRAVRRFAAHLQPGPLARSIPPPQGPNDLSVVLWLVIGKRRILLGGDLEDVTDIRIGWGAVLRAVISKGERASLFKIAHHGSRNADREAIWNTKLERDPQAATTRYNKLRRPLPTEHDRRRISERTPRGLVAGASRQIAPADADVAAVIARQTRDGLWRPSGKVGQIQYVGHTGSNDPQGWSVTTFGAVEAI